MSKYSLYIICFILAFIGFFLFLYKVLFLQFPLFPYKNTSAWNIESELIFEAENAPVSVVLQIPYTTDAYLISKENFIGKSYGYKTVATETDSYVRFTKRNAKNKQSLYYTATIRPNNELYVLPQSAPDFLLAPSFSGASLEAAEAIITEIGKQSSDIRSFVNLLVDRIKFPTNDNNMNFLLQKEKVTPLFEVELAVNLLALAGIPSQSIHGIALVEGRNLPIEHWLEIFFDETWYSFDFAKEEFATPKNFLPWWKGNKSLVNATGINTLATQISLQPKLETKLDAAIIKNENRPVYIKFSLFSLPIETQALYKTIMLIPLGAFLLVILRNVVGIGTFGTFMPILIALAFLETDLLWGVVLFSLITAIGMFVRLLFERLKLLLVPRLAAVLIIVVLIMASISIISYQLGFQSGLSVAMFPMIILTMTIERMSISWEENGASTAIKQGLGSLFVAVLMYLIFSSKFIAHLLFVFPELQFVLLACTLLLGRYTGYRLTDYIRFRTFVMEK